MIKSRKGFTLVELLVTVAIVSLVLVVAGGFVLNVINKSRDTTKVLTEASIMKTANTYAKEWPEEIAWVEENGEQYTCLMVSLLVEKGYIDRTKLSDVEKNNFIKIVRDSNNNIISEEFADAEVCQNVITRVPIPKRTDVCNDISYDGNIYDLINYDTEHIGYNFINSRNENEPIQESEVGDHPVTLRLEQNYVWSDGTVEDKKITCPIKKANPTLLLDAYESPGVKVGGGYAIVLNSDIKGKVSIKVSDTKYATASLNPDSVVNNGYIDVEEDKNIYINVLAARDKNADIYVTITVIPDGENAKNYYSGSVIHTISVNKGTGDLGIAKIPTSETVCNTKLVYTGSKQTLTKNTPKGYTYINNSHKATNAGEYLVKAQLKAGYKWEDETLGNKEFYCSIAKRDTAIQLVQSKKSITDLVGSVIKTQDISVAKIRGTYKLSGNTKDIPGVIEVVPTKYVGVPSLSFHKSYNAKKNSLYTATLRGLKVGTKKEFTVKFTPNDTKNFKSAEKKYTLTIRTNQYKLIYDATTNGGTACNPSSKKIYYNKPYSYNEETDSHESLCVPVKKDYDFIGWYTGKDKRSNATKITADTIFKQEKDIKVYAHFKSKKSVAITFHQYNGSSKESFVKEIYKYNNDTKYSLTMPTPTKYKKSGECGGSWSIRGWSKSTDAKGNDDYEAGGSGTFTKDTTLYAVYKSKEISLIIDYNGGSYIPSKHHRGYRNASGQKSGTGPWTDTVSQDAKRSGYTFLGWYEGSTKVISPGGSKSFTTCNSDRMISAWWQ